MCACFDRFGAEAAFILGEVSGNVGELARQQHGCRVVQAVLQAAAEKRLDVGPAVEGVLGPATDRRGRDGTPASRGCELEANALHRFANYAVQVALRIASDEQRAAMLALLLPRLHSLATSKHGSNVAELLLELAPTDDLADLSASLFGGAPDADDNLRRLMGHPFGNYVLQALVHRLDATARGAAIETLRRETTATNYGRSIVARCASAADEGHSENQPPQLRHSYSEA